MQIQKALTEDLSRAIQHLIDLNKSELKSIQDLNKQSLDTIAKLNQDKLGQIQEEIERKLNDNLQQNLKSFEDVTKNLGHLQSTAQKMIESTSSIDKLNNLFERTSSKGFGSFGEKYLESLLGQYINRQNWSKQVKVPGSTEIIDFVIHYGEKSIGLDCKFPVTRYQDYLDAPAEQKRQAHQAYVRAVIQMAGEISAKYSKVGFVDSLLMYLPSDGMYLEVVNIPEAMDKLRSYRVTLTSPTTILPLIGLIHEYEFKLNVQERAGDIIKGLQIVKKNVISFREEFRKLGEKIRLAQQNYDSADRSLVNVQNEVLKLESNQETVVEADLQQGVF
jgi:DNA recombination protein RmuC